jgi:hypothetical protein
MARQYRSPVRTVVGEEVRGVLAQHSENLSCARVDQPDVADHHRRYRLVAVGDPTDDRGCGGVVPDVVLDTFDARLVELATQ